MAIKDGRTYVFRYVSVQKAIDIFENNWLVLVKPSAWKDPFENFISKVRFRKNGKNRRITYLDNVFGICLTLGTETNLMWDAYTPFNNGVRLNFHLEYLINQLQNAPGFEANRFYFGQVNYVSQK